MHFLYRMDLNNSHQAYFTMMIIRSRMLALWEKEPKPYYDSMFFSEIDDCSGYHQKFENCPGSMTAFLELREIQQHLSVYAIVLKLWRAYTWAVNSIHYCIWLPRPFILFYNNPRRKKVKYIGNIFYFASITIINRVRNSEWLPAPLLHNRSK